MFCVEIVSYLSLFSLSMNLTRLEPLFPPLLVHNSHPAETHYFPLTSQPPRRILLHTHGSAPYVHSNHVRSEDFELVIYSVINGCSVQLRGFDLRIDWTATLGRWSTRYFTTVVCWAVGIVSLVVCKAWRSGESNGIREFSLLVILYESVWVLIVRSACVPPVSHSLRDFGQRQLPKLMLVSYLLSLLPLPDYLFIGMEGEWLYAPIAPLLLMVASGLVCVSWMLLVVLMWPIGMIRHIYSPRFGEIIRFLEIKLMKCIQTAKRSHKRAKKQARINVLHFCINNLFHSLAGSLPVLLAHTFAVLRLRPFPAARACFTSWYSHSITQSRRISFWGSWRQ